MEPEGSILLTVICAYYIILLAFRVYQSLLYVAKMWKFCCIESRLSLLEFWSTK
jgi:hypothetical protein